MSGIDKFSKTFEEGNNHATGSKFDQADPLQKAVAIVRTVEKLKSQGIAVTKKAELDYLLALRTLEKANIDPQAIMPSSPAATPPQPIKRNPRDHPQEFQVAMEFSKKTVETVETLLEQGKHLTDAQLEEYQLCKRFLNKYSG